MTDKPEVEKNKEILDSIGFEDTKTLSDLMDSGVGRYFLVNVIAKRAKNIAGGSKPLADVDDPTNECYPYVYTEIKDDKLIVIPKKSANKMVDLLSERQ